MLTASARHRQACRLWAHTFSGFPCRLGVNSTLESAQPRDPASGSESRHSHRELRTKSGFTRSSYRNSYSTVAGVERSCGYCPFVGRL